MAPQTLGDRVRNFANTGRPQIEIKLSGGEQENVFLRTYSSLDKIEGTVSVTAPSDTQIDGVELAFFGYVKTFVDRISPSPAISARSDAFHEFLKQTQPLEDDFPDFLQAEQKYDIPFTFVVPDRLPESCMHKTNNDKLKDLHLQLPPSFGDKEVAGYGTGLMYDTAPEMARITYGVRVRLFKRRGNGGTSVFAERTQKVRIIPAFDEQPPVDVDGEDPEYRLRVEKGVKKSLMKPKSGRLVAEVHQPSSLKLPPPSDESCVPNTVTMATIQLRFDPTKEGASSGPPKLGQLSSKLKAATFFAHTPFSDFPSTKTQGYIASQGLYIDEIPLSARCMSSAQWHRHEHGEDADAPRRGSGMSLTGAEPPKPSGHHRPELPYYTAQLLIPIGLPKSRVLVPTFHSCLISHIYVLELNLSLPEQKGSVVLKVPLQVSSRSAQTALGENAGREIEQPLSPEEEELFRQPSPVLPPGSSSPMGHGGHTQSPSAPPPEYSSFAPRSGGFLRSQHASLHRSIALVR